MALTTSTMTFAPPKSSPLARTTSPFKDPRTPPSTPGKTAKLWDEYERRAVENAKKREVQSQTSHPPRTSASDIPRTSTSAIASARSSFDFKFNSRTTVSPPIAIANCKTCKLPITYSSGICEPCKKTIIYPSASGESTPPLSPSARNFASADLQELHNKLSREENNRPKATSPKRRSNCPLPAQMLDPPIRLSSLRPPPNQEPHQEAARSRKVSLTDPNEPFLRLQIAPNSHVPHSGSHPSTPTYPPTTPPSTSHSRTSTRPSSVANTMSPLSPVVHIPTQPYARHNSATPSELSTLYPYTSRTASINTGYGLQPAASAWDDWDSDGEGEKAGLVGWFAKSAKDKSKKKGRSDSKTSLDSIDRKLRDVREEEAKKSREHTRRKSVEQSTASSKGKKAESSKGSGRKRPSGFVRVFSCGACGED
ncbi:hypothetical protein BKA63DRAFT_257386 [Paraphoma chrysanthemicola]|nr:hypothetical protein BKA63DRAFT_257386 [Paraphoma chrysanthemicola]